jgi:hypothetical protein
MTLTGGIRGAAATLLCLAAGVVGCGGSIAHTTASSVASAPSTVTTTTTGSRASRAPRRGAPSRSRRPLAVSIPGRPPARTMPNGSIVIPPAPPAGKKVAASDSCDPRTVQTEHGGSKTVEAPPPPGLQARIFGARVVVDIDVGAPPAGCAPSFLVVLLANTRGRSQVSTHGVAIGSHPVQRLTLPLPSFFSAPPDVVRAYSATKNGRESRVSSVNVQ